MSDVTLWPAFPWTGEISAKAPAEFDASDPPRPGDPGGPPCTACARADDGYIWVSDLWRVRPVEGRHGVPMVLFLESREHADLGDLSRAAVADLGAMIVRIERAVRAVGDVGRVHFHHWGDGLAHFHMWFFARPVGAAQLRGVFLPFWDPLLPAVPQKSWERNLNVIGRSLADSGPDGQ